MVLHTVNSSPHRSQCLADCIRVITAPAALLLIEDGVYGATSPRLPVLDLLPEGVECFVLQPDLDARGLSVQRNRLFNSIDDAGFVELSVRCSQIQSWY
jgi:tRNA 2-thiouridine synthesizing protein B